MQVRPAMDDELEAAGLAVRQAYEVDGFGAGRYLQTVADARGRAADAEVVVALDDGGAVVGTVTYAPAGTRWAQVAGPGEAEFRMLGVVPAARGRRVGEALVRWCVERATAQGLHRLVLCSDRAMSGAHRLYGRLGFVRRPDLDWTPEPGVDLIAFSLDLQAGSTG